MLNNLYKNKKTIFYLMTIGFGFAILLFNLLTPMLADDYSYTFSWYDRSSITTLWGACLSMYAHYFSWGGRIITHFIATVFLLIGKPVFNIFNTAAYCWLEIGRAHV